MNIFPDDIVTPHAKQYVRLQNISFSKEFNDYWDLLPRIYGTKSMTFK